MGRKGLWILAALLVLAGGGAFLFSKSWRGAGAKSGGAGGESPSGPEIVLQKVDMREIRNGEAPYRFLSDRAVYRVLSENVTASDVTLLLQGIRGETVVRAPEADWDLKMGRIFLRAGATAQDRAGWSASVDSARLSLPERVMTSSGRATLSGPGLTVAGDNLVWHWREGKVELERPKTRVLPARAMGRKG